MSYIDYTPEQMETPMGQQKIISDIIDELNHQVQVNQTAQDFQIISYGKSSIDPTPYNPGQVFTKSIPHVLGYAPVFIVLSFVPAKFAGQSGFFSFPYYDGFMDFWATTDENNLNVNLQYSAGAFLDAYTYQFAYYLFNLPANLS